MITIRSNETKLHSITLLIKPTHACNFNCVYCYDVVNDAIKDKRLISFEKIEKIFNVLSENYLVVNCIWLGGEPLIYGYENFNRIFALQEKLKEEKSTKFFNSIQTNSSLINERYVDLFLKYNCKIGISFDGKNSRQTRGHCNSIIEKIIYLREKRLCFSGLYVLSKFNINNLIEDYELFKKLKINMKINRYLDVRDSSINVSDEEYAEKMFELFKHYYNDKNKVIKIEPFEEYISMITLNRMHSCRYGSCLYKFLCIDSFGDLYTCARNSFSFMNIDDVSSLSDIFFSSEYIKYNEETRERIKKCKSCEYFKYCGSGCLYEHKLGIKTCNEFKILFNNVFRFVTNENKLK